MGNEARKLLLSDADQERLRVEGVLRVMERVGSEPKRIESALFDTLYEERRRLEGDSNRKRAHEQGAFYDDIYREALHADTQTQRRLLKRVVSFFAEEVTGHFDERVFGFATRVVPVGLNVLLNALSPIKLARAVTHGFSTLEDRVVLGGEIDQLRRLSRIGTVVVVPTHLSNLDSILLGFGIHRVGIPPVLYGAGLNLFEHRIVAPFMSNLGAYKVDRRKKAWVYKEVLKTYATCTMELGYNNLFFPGGTRSRSGAVEASLKKGLLGTALEAYVRNLRQRRERPDVFVVPATLNYQLVLEAETLIDDHLKEAGKSRYIIEDDEFSKPRRIIDFVQRLFALDSRIHMVFSKAMDPFGNLVDDEGRSLDGRGRPIDRTRYVRREGEPVFDGQRDQEYVRELARAIVASYHRDTVVNSSNAASAMVFAWLRSRAADMDLFRLLRTGGPDESMTMAEAYERLDRVLAVLRGMAADGRLRLDETVSSGDAARVLDEAMAHLAAYHNRPALERRGDRLFHVDRNLLLYYQNRLSTYRLSLMEAAA